MMKIKFKFNILVIGMATLCSCNKYFDKVNNVQIKKEGFFTFYKNVNIFDYYSNVNFKADNEVWYPKSFEVNLPKGIKYWESSNSENFNFFYQGGQVILIHIDLQKSSTENTVYTPTDLEIKEFIYQTLVNHNNKFSAEKIEINHSLKQIMIKKGSAKILLYNIANENYEAYFKALNTFRFYKKEYL